MFIAGPDIDTSGGWDAAIALAEKQRLPVWASPATGGSRLGFPENHPNFVNVLPPAIGAIAETLKEHDLVFVAGSSVFPYYPYIPGPFLADGSELVALTSDPGEAARAPMGDAIVGDVGRGLAALVDLVGESDRSAPAARPPAGDPPEGEPMSGSQAVAALAAAWPEDGIAVLEAPSSTMAMRNRLRLGRPAATTSAPAAGSASASGRGRRAARAAGPAVVAILGEGSAQYGITALWTRGRLQGCR